MTSACKGTWTLNTQYIQILREDSSELFCPLLCSSTAYLGWGSKDIPEGRPIFSPAASSSSRAASGLDGRCNCCSISSVYLRVSPPGWTYLKLLPREPKRPPNHMLKISQPARLVVEERSLRFSIKQTYFAVPLLINCS